MQQTVESYRSLHAGTAGEAERRASAQRMVNQYYDLVTDFYEYGWGRSFHFAHRLAGETLRESIVRHEHRLALRLRLEAGMRVLDVGCGVGGPLVNIARLTGASVVGLNNNAYQVRRGQRHIEDACLADRCGFLEGDFMAIPAPDASFDAAYAIESTCHAPSRRGVFAEVLRVLRPGAFFGGYEWCTTARFEPDNALHQQIKQGIQEGNALPDITSTADVDEALREAGFELLEARDLAPDCDHGMPWFDPLRGGDLSLSGLGRTKAGRLATSAAVRLLERVRLAPRGAGEVHHVLNIAADTLLQGGDLGIFTPMYFFVARKPKGH